MSKNLINERILYNTSNINIIAVDKIDYGHFNLIYIVACFLGKIYFINYNIRKSSP
jgi:hypothetical protein